MQQQTAEMTTQLNVEWADMTVVVALCVLHTVKCRYSLRRTLKPCGWERDS